MSTISVVLFDLGNVLISIHPERFAATLGIDHRSDQSRRLQVVQLMQRYERGELETDRFFEQLGQVFSGKFSRQRLTEALEKVLGNPIEGMPDLLQRVASSVPVGMVSNTNETHFEYCRRNFTFLSIIPHHFLSWKLRVMKPDAAYYARVLEQLALPANRIVFIDDIPENVEGAKQAGMVGIVFEGAQRLRQELEALGVV
jgi:HAD superfamily hydrolase (TIGR01509 family)